MTIQNINIGRAANDGTGDDLREAFIKINQNFQYVETFAEQTGANLGTAGAEVFANIIDGTLNFRRLIAGNNVTLNQFDNSIEIVATVPDSRFIASTDSGSVILGNGININIVGNDAVTVTGDENTKTITISSSLQDDLTPALGGTLNANLEDINAVKNLNTQGIVANTVNINTGDFVEINSTDVNLTNINGIDWDVNIGRLFTFDFGELQPNYLNILDFVVRQIGVDMGTFVVPTPGPIDLGII